MKINELEDLLGVTRSTVRYYEDEGLVTPPRTENGYREYGDEEVQVLQKIIVMRKLGVGVPEIRELINGKADLHDVLEQNIEKLRKDQQNIESAIEMCSELEADADDWDSIDPPKYLKNIYEGEQNGAHFAKAGEISFRQLNLAITLIGFLAVVPTPQNKLYSEHSNDPIPDDIRGNKKDGDEYDTIGNVIEKGGKRKIALIAAVVIFVLFAAWNAYNWWGGLASVISMLIH